MGYRRWAEIQLSAGVDPWRPNTGRNGTTRCSLSGASVRGAPAATRTPATSVRWRTSASGTLLANVTFSMPSRDKPNPNPATPATPTADSARRARRTTATRRAARQHRLGLARATADARSRRARHGHQGVSAVRQRVRDRRSLLSERRRAASTERRRRSADRTRHRRPLSHSRASSAKAAWAASTWPST